jgi:PTS system nitrogen regulatory IIA component
MGAGELIAADGVVIGLRVLNKKDALKELARRAALAVDIDQSIILKALVDREALGSTGVGMGVALPHARIAGLQRITGLFARLARPIDFEAIDEAPVDLVFLLLGPDPGGTEYMKALASISRVLRNRGSLARLRAAGAEEVHRVFA